MAYKEANPPRLQPCPFCGSQEIGYHRHEAEHWIECAGCGVLAYYAGRLTPAEVGTRWNRRAEPTCSDCGSVFQNGEQQQSADDGQPLCQECYTARCGERDREDEPWRLGDIEYDRSRVDG